MAQVNQAKLEAELRKVSQEAQDAKKRASIAEQAANQLYTQRTADPIHIFQQPQPPAPPPAPVVVNSLSADSVAQAMRDAIREERQTIQQMMANHGQSFKEVLQEAVHRHVQPAQASASSSDPQGSSHASERGVSALKKMFEKKAGRKIVIKVAPEAGGSTAPYPTPRSDPMPLGPEVAMNEQGVKGKDAPENLEDISVGKRSRPNPAVSAKTAKKEARQAIIARRPLIPTSTEGNRKRAADFEPDMPDRRQPNPATLRPEPPERETRGIYAKKRKAGFAPDDPNKKRPNPARVRSEVRNLAQQLVSLYAQRQQEMAKQEAADIFRRSLGQPIRMDQRDNKRSYDDMIDDYEQKARTRPRTLGRNLTGFVPMIPTVA